MLDIASYYRKKILKFYELILSQVHHFLFFNIRMCNTKNQKNHFILCQYLLTKEGFEREFEKKYTFYDSSSFT